MPYWIWTISVRGPEIYGPYSSHSEAQIYGDRNLDTSFEIEELPTTSETAATRKLRPIIEKSGYKSSQVGRIGHPG